MSYYVSANDVDLHLKDLPDNVRTDCIYAGFHFEDFEGSNLTGVYYIDGKWSYLEDILLQIAPYVVEPSYIVFRGEENELWKIWYDDNVMSIFDSQLIWNEEPTSETRY